MNRTFLLALLSCAASSSWAHEGHGLSGPSHWHATDVLGFVAGVAALVAALWWRGRK